MRQAVAYDEYLAVIAADVVPAAASKMAAAFFMTWANFLLDWREFRELLG